VREWCGRSERTGNPHWNISVHVYDEEDIDPKEVASTIDDALQRRFPSAQIKKSPSFENLIK
jgi:hypothetical protein